MTKTQGNWIIVLLLALLVSSGVTCAGVVNLDNKTISPLTQELLDSM